MNTTNITPIACILCGTPATGPAQDRETLERQGWTTIDLFGRVGGGVTWLVCPKCSAGRAAAAEQEAPTPDAQQEAQTRLFRAAIEAEGRGLNVDSLCDEPEFEEIANRFSVSSGDLCSLMQQREQGRQSIDVLPPPICERQIENYGGDCDAQEWEEEQAALAAMGEESICAGVREQREGGVK